MKNDKISPKVIERLTKYLRCLENFDMDDYVSSKDLAEMMSYTAAKVRKDLSNFGEFGIRGKGYNVRALYSDIENILGINKRNNVIVVGMGRLGTGLTSEPEFTRDNFRIAGVFDNSAEKIGTEINGFKVLDIKEIPEYIKTHDISIAILTVPKIVCQNVAEYLIKAGVRAILNFAPIKIDVPPEVVVENIDLYAKLQELNYWKEKKKNTKKTKKTTKAE